ncbi:GNAT family N-acetyltransferase [Mariniflexile maritimum]|uniref:GNAT family N-acetyltransferase n=1 Tax=Mariniflexile maritimum TaxID=2682493 RepID=UPI0012F6C50A|nr:GNAT family N-acetyltransferase [Mariniflexile maritimum]
MIRLNPFLSPTFTKVWEAHFNGQKPSLRFDFIKELSFVASKTPNLYLNTGKNLTKGVSYSLNEDSTVQDFRKKTCLIYDVPQYAGVETKTGVKNLKVKKIKQYPGFLIDLKNHSDFNDYLKKTFSKSSIQKFNRYKKRLETCFNMKEKMWMGQMEKAEYDTVFNHFHTLLTKRFEDKQTTNNNLYPEEWAFYKEVAYPMILEKKAALHVVYNEDTPISVRLLYFTDTIIFDAITVFDIDYTKFHIGKVALMKMLEWSFKSEYRVFDFSKGYFDYKESWSDSKYNFEYHLYYDSASFTATACATALASFFKLKQFLRDKEVNNKLHKLRFFLKKKPSATSQTNLIINNEESEYLKDANWLPIDLNHPNHAFLKKHVYDFLFLNSEHIKNTEVFTATNTKNQSVYLIKGKTNQLVLSHP